MAKYISDSEKKELLALKQEELTISLISKLFGKTTSLSKNTKENGKRGFEIVPPKFDVRAKMKLKAGEYINTEDVDTTVGSFLFNKLMIEGMIENIVPGGYYNEVINKKGFNKLVDMISRGLMLGDISVNPTLIRWLKQYEFYGMKACTIFSPSYSEGLLRQHVEISKEKEKLLKTHDLSTPAGMAEVEDTLVASARKLLKDDTGMTLFDSGARGDFSNDYKNMNLMLGPVPIPGQDGKFEMVTSNYIEGLQKEDWVSAGNNIVNSAYPKAVGTQKGGYYKIAS